MRRRPRHDSAQSQRYHNRVAGRYDGIYDDEYWEFHDELTWRAIRPHLPGDLSAPCIDLGCGTGKWGLKLLKSGFATTFLDHAAKMVDQLRARAEALGPKSRLGTFVVSDIVDLSGLPGDHFALALAMGDPLSICSDAARAAAEIHRILRPGGILIATADNKLAALDHFLEKGNLDGLEQFVRSSRTHWLTDQQSEQFELRTFTPKTLRRLFEVAGYEVLGLSGKPILPVRRHREVLSRPEAVDRLLAIEKLLAGDETSAAAAGHLQIIVRRALDRVSV